MKSKLFIAAFGITFIAASSLIADTVLFNNTVQEGKAFANGTAEIDSTVKFPVTNTDTLKFTSSQTFANGGLEFFGPNLLIPVGESIISFSAYSEDANALNGFSVQMTTGSQTFDNSNGTWTLDGATGNVANFTANAWHTMELDLSSNPNFVAGVSELDGFVTIKTNSLVPTVISIGDIRLISPIPEPSTYVAIAGLLALGAVVIRRRRRA